VASAADHIELANRNQEVLEYLMKEPGRFPEWITSVAFYKALHVVDAVLDEVGENAPTDHRMRADKLKGQRRFTHIYENYRPLSNASSVARYLSDLHGKEYRRFTDFLSPERVVSEMVRHRLHQVEESCAKLLGPHWKVLKRAAPRPA
jgi:hypothetical protein